MKRFSVIAAMCFVAFYATNLQAQFRGGGGGMRGGGGGGAIHSGGGGRSAAPAGPVGPRVSPAPAQGRPMNGPVVHAPSTFTGRPQFNGGARINGGGHIRGPFVGRGNGVGVIVPSFGYGYPGFGYYDPFLAAGPYAPYYPSYAEQYPASDYVTAQAPSYDSNQVNALTSEVEQLRDEIYRLRQQSTPQIFNAPPFEQPAPTTRPAQPTLLIFRDGRQIEAQGYAVVGQTIWIVTEQTSTRMPLSDLDIAATQKANAERGGRFLLPRTN